MQSCCERQTHLQKNAVCPFACADVQRCSMLMFTGRVGLHGPVWLCWQAMSWCSMKLCLPLCTSVLRLSFSCILPLRCNKPGCPEQCCSLKLSVRWVDLCQRPGVEAGEQRWHGVRVCSQAPTDAQCCPLATFSQSYTADRD